MNTAVATMPKVDLRKLPFLAKQKLATVELPALYQKAQQALRECYRIDECKDIADKHQAIAIYAKQAKNERLCFYAQRIQLRAMVRLGDLLNSIPSPSERVKAADNAGIAKQSRYRAIHAASAIPRDMLNDLIEKTPPASKEEINKLAREFREANVVRPWDKTSSEYRQALGCVTGIQQQTKLLRKAILSLTSEEEVKIRESLVKAAEDIDSILMLMERLGK